ncbi:Gldg family protein [Desulfatirhabdium butyrativorans]|uniref:Gldg family protein n=1 Tax=Desulfatirhabdium butyrativorans TaxID=340467 RepID=UPI0003F50CAC|nr:Gldg family protein [Desulfatirhabdium butyrativorans]
MMKTFHPYLRFVSYLVLVILVNAAGITLFARFDLTANRMYSLSEVSKSVVHTLSEPLTIQVFFSKNLPAPHNNTERYLHDLLEAYGAYANDRFSYAFHDVDAKQASAESEKNQKLAESYGITPVQIQVVENDEISFQKAYMGLVLIHGDLVERIPAITNTDGLEYRLTTAIQKLNNKISALLRITDPIQVKLYYSTSMDSLAPYIGLKDLSSLPSEIKRMVDRLNARMYNKLVFTHIDPSKTEIPETELSDLHIMTLKWPALDNGKLPEGHGSVGLVVEHGKKSLAIPLLQVFKVPIIGTQYQMPEMQQIENQINAQVESLININETLGYLADHGTPSLYGASMGAPQRNSESVDIFRNLADETYSLKEVRLKDGPIPDEFNTLIIAGPTEPFSDNDLYQIDQFLMKGKSLAIFADAFKEIQGQQGMMQGGTHEQVNTGLEKLLEHYGMHIEPAIVLDESCYKQQVPQQYGGGERPLYFAPLIKNENIVKDHAFMKPIRGLIAYRMSPLTMDEQKLKQMGLKGGYLFSSSDKSWEMKPPIRLNPMMIAPPGQAERSRKWLACLVEGDFPSYFAGKPVPEKPKPEADASDKGQGAKAQDGKTENSKPAAPAVDLSGMKQEGATIEKGKPGKIFLTTSSALLTDVILDEAGRSPNAIWLMNTIDYLNNREAVAMMRGKEQRFNPLADISPTLKTVLKTFNIAGLPVLVILAGLGVYASRSARKRSIQQRFQRG